MSGEALRARSQANVELPRPAPTNRSMDSWANEGGSFLSSAKCESRCVLDAPVAPARPVGTNARSYLLPALERALNGAALSRGEIETAAIDSTGLSRLETEAWEQLGHWADEAEVRFRDKNYAAFHHDWLRDLHSKLAQ